MPQFLVEHRKRCGPTPDRYFMSRVVKSNMSPKGGSYFQIKGSGYLYVFPVTFRQINGLAHLDHRASSRKMRSIRLLIKPVSANPHQTPAGSTSLYASAADSFTSFAKLQMTYRLHHPSQESPPLHGQPGSNNGL